MVDFKQFLLYIRKMEINFQGKAVKTLFNFVDRVRAKTLFLGKGPQPFFWGKISALEFLLIWENGPLFNAREKKNKLIKLWVSYSKKR